MTDVVVMVPMMNRAWAMPSPETFSIPPIAALLDRYIDNSQEWADPFARNSGRAWWTNDLDPGTTARWNDEATVFAERLPADLAGVLFDPPYSPRQISEVYRRVGHTIGMEETQNGRLYSTVRSSLAPKVRPGGYAISFGWNSSGFGHARGFIPIEYLLVCHGGAHNDTIVVVEQKVNGHLAGFSA